MTKSRRGSRHAFLREATAEVHDNLEAVVERRAYLSAIPDYGQYLQRLYAFHQSFLDAMRAYCTDLAEAWKLDRHGTWLARDLADLGLAPLKAEVAGYAAPRIDDRASAFGAAYVLFGSSLGARILVNRARKLDLPEGCGISYLASLATSGGWALFLAGLESEPELSEPELLRGALETFRCFEDHMTRSIV